MRRESRRRGARRHDPPAPLPRRRADEQKVREALAALSQTERLEALCNVLLSRSVKLGGASRIVLGARQFGLLGDVLGAIRSYQRS